MRIGYSANFFTNASAQSMGKRGGVYNPLF